MPSDKLGQAHFATRDNAPSFATRLAKVRLKRLFLGDAPRSGFQLANVTIRQDGTTLTCRYATP